MTTVPAGSVSRLTVRNARIEDAGDYECRHTSAVIVRYTVSVSGEYSWLTAHFCCHNYIVMGIVI